MTTQASIPQKWYVPFANGDTSRVELPVTTADPTRASQTLGFPPLTMQPPESGGVPPQGEDFNGGMNQIARVAWWTLLCGGWPYDATFATNSNIGGYPNGATLQSADLRGQWINTTDNNQVNPDTTGTNWVPGFQYGSTALSGLTGGTVTPTPAQAAKNSITLAGTLTSALTIVLPTWTKNWTITNNTSGAFTVIVKTLAGSGVTIPQNGAPTRVSGDGTNITQVGENIAQATTTSQAVPMSQASGVVGTARNLVCNVASLGTTMAFSANEIIVETALGGVRYCVSNFSATLTTTNTGANGMDTGLAPASGYLGVYAIYNPTTGTAALLGVVGSASVLPFVYAGANMPAGYTASALISVWPTNASRQPIIAYQADNRIHFNNVVTNVTNTSGVLTAQLINTAIPPNARRLAGTLSMTSTVAANLGMSIALNANGVGVQSVAGVVTTSGQPLTSAFDVPVFSSQTVTYSANGSGGTLSFNIQVSSYSI